MSQSWQNALSKQKSIKSLVLGLLLFTPALFPMSIPHYLSSWSILMLLFGLFFFYANRTILKKDKVILTLVIILTGFFISALISNTIAGWPILTIHALETDSKLFLVIFWLLAIYKAKNSWVWFYRSLPIGGIIIGLHAGYDIFVMNDWRASNTLNSNGIYNPIFFGSWAAILSFLILYSYSLSEWYKVLGKKTALIFYGISFLLASFATFYSMSRSAWLIYLVLSFLSLILSKKRKIFFIIGLLLVVISLAVISQNKTLSNTLIQRVTIIQQSINKYFSNPPPFDAYLGSTPERIARWQASIKLFKQKPLFGMGAGNSPVGLNQLVAEKLTYTMFKTDLKGTSNLHNMFFSTLVDKGIVGLFFLLSLFLYLFYFFLSQLKNNSNLAIMGIFHTIGFTILSLISDPLMFNNPGILFLPLVLIYVVHLRYLSSKRLN